MLFELWLSARHERRLLARGAVAPSDPVYPTMRWAYPATFGTMALEGVVRGGAPDAVLTAGLVVFSVAKLLKFWAIATLGERWTYKVIVLPGEPLVSAGPYRLMRHPNYVAVAGELIGMALMTGAAVTGPAGTLLFGALVRRRIDAEERALGRRGIY